jgi:hypothetical protein
MIQVVDAGFYNVQVFDDQGRVVGYFGSPGSHQGAMDLPAGLDVHEEDLDLFEKYVHPAFEAERLVLVTNQFGNQKVNVYAIGHLKPGKTALDVAPGRANVTLGTTTQPVRDPLATPRRPSTRAVTPSGPTAAVR